MSKKINRRSIIYWQTRYEHLQTQQLSKGDEFYDDLVHAYEVSLINIEKDIARFYMQFSEDNNISYAEAKMMLTNKERKRFQMELDEYTERAKSLNNSKALDRKLKNASTVHRLSRLESLQIQIAQNIEHLYNKYNIGLLSLSKSVLNETYFKSIFEVQKGLGFGKPFSKLDTKTVENIIVKPWVKDGKNFSDRIWTDKERLLKSLDTKLKDAFIRGEKPGNLIRDITKEFNVSKFNASRLIQTELAYFNSMSNLKSYKELGIEKYKIIATLDELTSDICQDLDGEVFLVSKYEVGLTAPPFHPFCRTTTAPYFGTGGGERFARGKDGKGYYVPADITYKEWKEKYVNI